MTVRFNRPGRDRSRWRRCRDRAGGGLLDSTYSIDSTHIEPIQYNDTASWNYEPTAEEYYYGFGCTIVSTGSKSRLWRSSHRL